LEKIKIKKNFKKQISSPTGHALTDPRNGVIECFLADDLSFTIEVMASDRENFQVFILDLSFLEKDF
jgi:hypothetical protein